MKREKLIELIRNGIACPGHIDPFGDHCEACPYSDSKECDLEWLADHLIANDVTVGKRLTEYLHPVDTYEGLKGKYLVFKADTGEQVVNCFVLRPEKDTAAIEALRTYASITDNETLATDIYNWVGLPKEME